MKLLVAIFALALSAATSASACELEEMTDESYISKQVSAGAAEADAKAAQEAALAQRDRNLEAARQVFAKRFGLGVEALRVATNSPEKTSSDADQRSRTDPSYR